MNKTLKGIICTFSLFVAVPFFVMGIIFRFIEIGFKAGMELVDSFTEEARKNRLV